MPRTQQKRPRSEQDAMESTQSSDPDATQSDLSPDGETSS